MKRRKLKPYVIPTIYTMVIMVIFASMMFMNVSLNQSATKNEGDIESDYVIDVLEPNEIPVVSEVTSKISLPYSGEDVEIEVNYYSKDDEIEEQEESLIYYSSTYMQNTGIIYSSENNFEIIAVLDGTVKNITEVPILGTVIEIEHDNDYVSYYYSVSEVKVSIGDKVINGTILAYSGKSEIENIKDNHFLFEIYYQGKTIDPNFFYELEIEN